MEQPWRNNHQQSCRLEDLPSLVRHELLRVLQYADICALVRASPVFLQQYLRERPVILRALLDSTLGSVSSDAYAVYQSSLASFADTRSPDSIKSLLKSYEDDLSSTTSAPFVSRGPNEKTAVAMITFHKSVIEPLAYAYARWSLGNLANAVEELTSAAPPAKILDVLSVSESRRVVRAMYRYQLCCKLFGAKERGYPRYYYEHDPRIDIRRNFLSIFEPWEVEEIACIYTFLREHLSVLFHDIYTDIQGMITESVDVRGPQWGNLDLNLRRSMIQEDLLVGTLSRGLTLLHRTICVPQNHQSLVSIVETGIAWPAGGFLEREAFSQWAQANLTPVDPRDRLRSEKQISRDPLPFNGDGESDENNPRPPFAWVLIWGGTYSNLFGDFIGGAMRVWGYVMWDCGRIEGTGADEVILRQRYALWRDSDPRDGFQ